MGQSPVLLLLLWLTPFLLIFFLQHPFFVYSSTPFSFSSVHDYHLCPDKQSLALFQFKQTLSISIHSDDSEYCDYYGIYYPKTNLWNMSFDCCKWDGVTCNRLTGDVIGLDLSCSQLVGVLHSNSSLFQLPHLQRLNLAFNDFSGSVIPREFGRFAIDLTHLNLSYSRVSGPVPLEISHLSKLVSLDLSYNYNLILNDSNTEFQHQFLNFLLQKLTRLRHLSLSYVHIDSVLPRNLSSFYSLTFLDLSGTRLRGELPHEIFFLPNLKTLYLGDNPTVTGVLPQSNLGASNGSSITSLRALDLSRNTMFLSEGLADIVGSLKSLKSLILIDCNLTGVIPKFIFNLTHLTVLDLSQNSLGGQIPNGNLVRLRSLALSYNEYIGPFPSWVANLSQLVYLNLKNNKMMGPLPSNITGLQKLTHLSLSNNILSGTIPSWVFDLPLLEVLDLGYNYLKGQLGEFQFKSNSLKAILLSSNKLNGIVEIEMFSSLKKLVTLSLSYNNNLSVRLSTTNNTIINITFPNLKRLHLSSLKIKEFPYFLRAMENLESLDLSNNQIHGRVPEWVPSKWRDSLQVLQLRFNFLEESIHLWICNSTSLQYLDLSSNNFVGILPHCLGNLSDSLSTLDLSTNHFHSTIPSTFANLSNLWDLNLGSNFLEGSIPLWICNFTSTRYLDLSINNFGGVLPHCLGNLSDSLSILDLSKNHFHDTIPSTFANLSNLWILNLDSNFLEGSIPLWICNSTSLRDLYLSSNNFGGVLPHCLGNLSDSLSRLDLSTNHFHGTIPSTFANLSNLWNLNLEGNQFEDTFPRWMETLPRLRVLILRSNEFHGPISISNISKTKYPFPNLYVMDLSNNEFRGEIPNVLGTFQFLIDLDLHNNNFRGTIPSTFAKGNLLRSLNLHNNQLQGAVPSSLANCAELEVLDLGRNQINDTFPNWLGTLPELHVLVLSFNRFHGPINTNSKNKNPFPKLRIIDLSCNEFSGRLPELFFKNFSAMVYVDENKKETEYVGDTGNYQSSVELVMKGVTMEIERILTILTTIDLSSNKFKGEIPDVIGNLKFLRQLNLSHNSLFGRIPSLLGNLSVLESLDLNSNQLVGEIPQELANLNSLGTLNLSHNHLRGRIPSGKQFNTFLNDSYYGNLALCGFPLSSCEKGETPQPPVLQEENDSDFMGGFTWEAVLIGYGCGTVLGFVIGYIMYLVGKPKWFTGIVQRELCRKVRSPQRRGYKHHGRRN